MRRCVLALTCASFVLAACRPDSPAAGGSAAEASALARRHLALQASPSSQRAAATVTRASRGLLRQGQCYARSFSLPGATILEVPDLYGNAAADAEVLDLANLSWAPTAPMGTVRGASAAAQLADGRVLVTGGNDATGTALATAELFDAAAGTWSAAPSLVTGARFSHVAATLRDGRVLVAGGVGQGGATAVQTAELFEPASRTWAATGAPLAPRQEARAVVLADGRVLVAGGFDLSYTAVATAELYDPARGAWTATGSMTAPRGELALALLPDGRVLASGGYDATYTATNTAELYDPATDTWTSLSSPLVFSHAFHDAVLVDATHVLLVGGDGGPQAGSSSQSHTELIELSSLTASASGELTLARQASSSLRLADGSVLTIGGCTRSYTATPSSERWDPASGRWSVLGGAPRGRLFAILQRLSAARLLVAGGEYAGYPTTYPTDSAVLDLSTGQARLVGGMLQDRLQAYSAPLADGRVVAFGGTAPGLGWLASSEVFDDASGQWTAAGSLAAPVTNGLAVVRLADGRLLATGGHAPTTGATRADAQVFDPATGAWTLVTPMRSPRAWHQLLLLPDGRALALAGHDGTSALATTELYDPRLDTWSAGPTLVTPRYQLGAALAADGSVVVAGGAPGAASGTSEVLDPGLAAWTAAGALGYPRTQPTLVRDGSGQVVLYGGQPDVEVFDAPTRSWQFLGAKLGTSPLGTSAPLLSGQGTAVVVQSSYADDVLDAELLGTFQPVTVTVQGGLAPVSVKAQGGGTLDAAAGQFFPPLAGSGSTTLTATDASGASASVVVRYSPATATPVALSVTGGTDLGPTRVAPAAFPQVARKTTLTLGFSGTRHATQVTGATLSGAFSFVGGAYPGTGGTCGAELSRPCTLVLQFQPTTVGPQTSAARLSYLDGARFHSLSIALQGTGERPDAARQVLVAYNGGSPDSVALKDYYLAHRPGFAGAQVLALTTTAGEVVAQADYLAQLEAPVVQWLQANPTLDIRYVVWMYGLPTRTTAGPSVTYQLSQSLQTRNLSTGKAYGTAGVDQFNRLAYPGTTALFTAMNMGSVAATQAYIDKVAAMAAAMPTPDVVVSALAAGRGGTSYLFEDAQGYAGYSLGQAFQGAMLSLNPQAQSTYVPQPSPLVNQAADLSGYFSWGVHAGLPATYAVDGTVRFTGNSSWFLIATAESFNGQLGCSQGCFSRWFAENSWGGTAYGEGPAGAVSHVEEPYVGGINGPTYFAMWEAGFLFAEAAWNSRNTPAFLALGDPLITR
jgi:Kelch motif